MHDITKSILVVSAALALLAVGIGAASAVTVNSWNGTNPVNDTFTVDNQTESLRVYAENVTESANSPMTEGSVDAFVWGIENGTVQTEVANATLTTNQTAGTYSQMWEYSQLSSYDQYKVNVTGPGAEQVAVSRVDVIYGAGGGGSGGLGLGSLPDLPMREVLAFSIVVLVVGAGAVYQRGL